MEPIGQDRRMRQERQERRMRRMRQVRQMRQERQVHQWEMQKSPPEKEMHPYLKHFTIP